MSFDDFGEQRTNDFEKATGEKMVEWRRKTDMLAGGTHNVNREKREGNEMEEKRKKIRSETKD